ncbi:hypothetical protein LWC34_45300 [Kibdelosporangium philippinense]|uniref:Uncharacterized protein n=2 Tax=Kibdelosporangium philippinense TaxID=211113 RepID=A0ABS8ZQT6_9PSEU|nr:hypothetical protein [Kibdelosporangium philippinense]MCE7009977.1 hypothetical protein [Kibdelosporangium philippinense]
MAKLTEEEKARRALNRRRKAALEAEEDAIRWEEKQREWDANGTRLTWAELVARVPCRGCGLPVIDGRGGWPALLAMDDEQRAEYEAADADFKERHADCRSHRWSMEGSATAHCGFCCPPPPLSEDQLAAVASVLTRVRPKDPAELDTWQLTLTCDHVIRKTQHHSHTYWSASVATCPDCQRIRGIVTTERLPPSVVRRDAEQHRLADDLAKARLEHERVQKRADSVRTRINELESQLADLDKPR